MENELKNNIKKASQEEQYLIRKNIVRLLKKGVKNSEIAETLDVSERHVRAVKKAYKDNGLDGIKLKKRGRTKGENHILNEKQEKEIQNIIIDKNPDQLKLAGCMWTRKNIRELIKNKYNVDIKLSTLGYYLSRWGFSVQRPVKRAYKQDKNKIDGWLNVEFPGITKRAEEENAEIFFGDETGIQNCSNYAKGYAPVGKTPVIEIETKKIKINMMSAISKRGKLRFMLYKENMTSEKFIDFLRRLIKDTDKKVFLVLDNLRVHHSKKVMAWVDDHKNNIELFYLPPYAPEYNPDELVNGDLKRDISTSSIVKTEDELKQKTRSYLKKLQLNSNKISSFFLAPFTAYAS